jgi:ribose transport system permease protein
MNKLNIKEFAKSFSRVGGIGALLILIMVTTAIVNLQFLSAYNIRNIMRWTGLFGILSLGVAFVIITGGIDLSIGSVVGLAGSISAYLMVKAEFPISLTLLIVLVVSVSIGLFHGLLITKIHVQPFVVTLCGLFLYRGLARFFMDDRTQGYGKDFMNIKFLAAGRIPSAFWPEGTTPPQFFVNWSLPMPFVILVILAIILAFVLNKTVYGQHLKATGRNVSAARFSGIHTDKVTIIAYIVSSTFAGFSGLLFSLDLNTVQPSSLGTMYELYAIAGCVVGGISLRGGEGSILGVVLGTAIVRVLYNAINVSGVSTQLESVVLGLVILIGVSADEVVQIISARRKVQESMALARKAAQITAESEVV